MNKEEILNDDFIENEVPQPKSHKKIKIAIAVAASLAIIATATLLVGYFKFDWFKSEEYNIDAKISRNLYQANYYTETKSIKTRTSFTSGVAEEKEFFVYTNFMVMQTDRKELENNDFLNTATLVILDTKMEIEKEQKEVTSFNIFEQSKIDEFKSNPDGSKYPMAIFSFYENGKIADIQLPNNMDYYNSEAIIELIESVIPKLTRNRKEDISNGLNIETKTNKNKRTLVETQAPREVENFKGSRLAKSIERNIEKGKITRIQSNTNLALRTDLEENEASFGFNDFSMDKNSEIISTGEQEDKEKAELIKELSKYYTFIKSDDLIESLKQKSKEEQEKEQILEEWQEDLNSQDSELRKLGFNLNGDGSVTLKTFNVFNSKVVVKLEIGVKSGKAYCQLKVGGATIGTSGITYEWSKSWSTGTIPIFEFWPVALVKIKLSLSGNAKVSIKFDSSAKTKLNLSIGGSFDATAKVVAGLENFLSVEPGARGTIISGNASLGVTSKGVSKSISFSGGKIVVFVKAYLLGWEAYNKEWTVFNGWRF